MSFRVAAGDGSVGAAGQTGGARKLDSKAQDEGPTAGLPRRVLALQINELQLLSLTYGVEFVIIKCSLKLGQDTHDCFLGS